MSNQAERKYLVIKEPEFMPLMIEAKPDSLELTAMQSTVGGYIETIGMRLKSGNHLIVIVDEEGALSGKKANVVLSAGGRMAGVIVGTLMVCAVEGPEFVPLTREEADSALQQLQSNTIQL